MIAASSSSPSVVTTPLLNTELPSTRKTASKSPKTRCRTTCESVPDVDSFLQKTLHPTPHGELLLPITDNPLPNATPECPTIDINLLSSIRNSTISINRITTSLRDWAHVDRLPEIDTSLIHCLQNVEHTLALNVLNQLKEPPTFIRQVDSRKPKDKSFFLKTVLSTPDKSFCITDDQTLLDCGAGGRGYISSTYVDLNSIPCTPLPYHIPVYNVDGTLNKGGAITRVCSLDMDIGTHCERITFRVTSV